MKDALLYAAAGSGFTFLMTTLGAAVVFLFKKDINDRFQRIFLGFAAGVMISASVFSLLIPSIEATKEAGGIGWIPASGGLLLGVAFLLLLDTLLPHLHAATNESEGIKTSWKRSTLMMLAVTLHNIPEGMAVGLAFALAAESGNYSAAAVLAVGIGLQNFPEGAAVSLPLRRDGSSAGKSFTYGMLSGIVEPVFAIIVVLASSVIKPLMPWFLSFAAGAMLYVVVEELIPEARLGDHSNTGTLSVIGGFVIMMILDVALS